MDVFIVTMTVECCYDFEEIHAVCSSLVKAKEEIVKLKKAHYGVKFNIQRWKMDGDEFESDFLEEV